MPQDPILYLGWLAALSVPIGVAVMSGRRLLLSRSFHAVAYAQVCGFAVAAAVGTGFFLIEGRPVDAGGVALALLSLPLWIAVRILCHKPPKPYPEIALVPVFSTARRPLLLTDAERVGRA